MSKGRTPFLPRFVPLPVFALSLTGLLVLACDSGERAPTGPSLPDAVTPPLTPSTNARAGLPTEPSRRGSPQASGADDDFVEVAGDNTVAQLLVANDTRRTVRYRAGNWFEPKDGSNQRMMITRTTPISPGELVVVPTACMQGDKRVPPRGARFFSRPKSPSGRLQQCQVECLTDAGPVLSVQQCVWRCERPAIEWTIVDNCNDGLQMRFRLFEYRGGQIVDRWPPNRNRHYVTERQGEEYSVTTRRYREGQQVCFGGEAGNSYWGVGIDGDRRCDRCCYGYPDYGIVGATYRAGC